jgi:Lysozyme like domain
MFGSGLAGNASQVAASIRQIKEDMASIEKSLKNIKGSQSGINILGAGGAGGSTRVNPTSGLGQGSPQFQGYNGGIQQAPTFSQAVAGNFAGNHPRAAAATWGALTAGSFAYNMVPGMQGVYDQRASMWAVNNRIATGSRINYDQQFGAMSGAFGNYATSANGMQMASSYLATRGVGLNSTAFRSIAGQAGGFTSLMPGMSTENATRAVADLNRASTVNRSMMLGVRTSYGNGTQRNMGFIAHDIERRIWGGKPSQKQLDKMLNNGRLQLQLQSMGFDDEQQQMLVQAMQQHAANPGGRLAIDAKTADARRGDSRSPWTQANRTNATESSKINSYSETMLAAFDAAQRTAQTINEMLGGLRDALAPLAAAKGFQGGLGMTAVGGALGSAVAGASGGFGGALLQNLLWNKFGGGAGAGRGALGSARGVAGGLLGRAGGAAGLMRGGLGLLAGAGAYYGMDKAEEWLNTNLGADQDSGWFRKGAATISRTLFDAAKGGVSGAAIGAGFAGAPGAVIGGTIGSVVGLGQGIWNAATGQGWDYGTKGSIGSAGSGGTEKTGNKTSSKSSAKGGGAAGAVQWAIGQVDNPDKDYTRLCDHFVARAYGLAHSGYATAYDHWKAIPSKYKHSDGNAPAGALVFWFTGTGRAGHVALSLGGGRVASNDILRRGRIDIVSIGTITQKWGAKYLGWTPPYFGGRVMASVIGGAYGDGGADGGSAANGEGNQQSGNSDAVNSTMGASSNVGLLGAANLSVDTYGGLSASASSVSSLMQTSLASRMGGSIGVGIGNAGVGKSRANTESGNRGATGDDTGSGAWDGKKTNNQLINWLLQSGMQGEKLRKMWAIAMRESGGNPKAFNGNQKTGDLSYGLYQINMLGKMGPARRKMFGIQRNEQLLDAQTNIDAMLKLSKGGTNFYAWDIDKSGYDGGSHAGAYTKWYREFPKYAKEAGLNGYSQGAWQLSKDEIAKVHKGEMILPASLAEVVRDSVRKSYAGQGKGGGGGNGGTFNFNVYPANASYAEAVKFAKYVKEIMEDEAALDKIGGA